MQIGMDPEAVEAEVAEWEAKAEELVAWTASRLAAIEALPWTGDARNATVDLFWNIHDGISTAVESLFTNPATMLRGNKEAFQQTDTGLASGIRSAMG